jgi:hypothetical protein
MAGLGESSDKGLRALQSLLIEARWNCSLELLL